MITALGEASLTEPRFCSGRASAVLHGTSDALTSSVSLARPICVQQVRQPGVTASSAYAAAGRFPLGKACYTGCREQDMQERTAEVRSLGQPPITGNNLKSRQAQCFNSIQPQGKSESFKYYSAACVKAVRAKFILSKYQSREGRWSTARKHGLCLHSRAHVHPQRCQPACFPAAVRNELFAKSKDHRNMCNITQSQILCRSHQLAGRIPTASSQIKHSSHGVIPPD